MKREDAMKKIDDLANVVVTEIPEVIVIDGKEYSIKEDVTRGNREEMLVKYAEIYENIRDEIRDMDEVPEELVNIALVLRRAIIFLKDFRQSDEIEDKKRWMEYIKRVGL